MSISLVVFISDNNACLSNISAIPLLINTTLSTSGWKTTPKYSSFFVIAPILVLYWFQPPSWVRNFVSKYEYVLPYLSVLVIYLFLEVVNSTPVLGILLLFAPILYFTSSLFCDITPLYIVDESSDVFRLLTYISLPLTSFL